jgi:predicted Zn-dependent protease
MSSAWTRQQAKSLAEQVLSYSRAMDCEVSLEQAHTSFARFAANEVTTSGSAFTLDIGITSGDGRRQGTVHATNSDPSTLQEAVARSEELMESAQPDPEYVEALPPQKYPVTPAFDQETADARPSERAKRAKIALDVARARGLQGSGFSETITRWTALANKNKNFGFFTSTLARFATTMRTADGTGSGWAGRVGPRLSGIPTQQLAERAAEKAKGSANPKALEPGRYTVVLEPQAVADLLGNLIGSLSRRMADQGRSFLSKTGGGNRIGEKIFSELITLRSDPFNPQVPGRSWAGGGGGAGAFLVFGGLGGGAFAGLPSRKTTWIDQGVVKALTVDRYWAKKIKSEPLPFSGSLKLEGGSGTAEQLVAGMDRGLLITHFFYIRTVNPQNVELTGLTRDGVWLVE